MRPKTRAIVLGAALVTGAAVVGIDWNQYIQKRYPNGSPVPPVINTKQTTLSGGTPLPVSCASGNVSSCMATANQNLLVSACKEVNATCKLTTAQAKNRVDYNFISAREGNLATKGYIPRTHGIIDGNSGVTIGIGVDLGQQTTAGLANEGVSPALIKTVKPYLRLKGPAALSYLNKHPLVLTVQQAQALTTAAQTHIIDTVASEYTANSSPPLNFFQLPACLSVWSKFVRKNACILERSHPWKMGGGSAEFKRLR
ncbi:MAG: hypothetical protein GJU72_07440 [Acidithiobacillus ferriphilus]|uniref:pesticin C-terminus-like muramidase n=1 Tax=Acidithiobacillus ferriphilus TaxID=1689834 RepID=UPI00243148C1|nr:pesticin C-terminus-like muramidase [Acidithiobacillus ferriphilus]MBW9248890.1 hypothetical protein [Acidithiobacillus ferriphilus]MBW9254110.1 hypothetical protein [Acidithiobacillus ferriphilus]